MKYMIILSIFLCLVSPVVAQKKTDGPLDTSVSLSFTINPVNKEIWIKPIFSVNTTHANIKVLKINRFEEDGVSPSYSGKVFIQKIVDHFFIDLSFNKLVGFLYDDSSGVKRSLHFGENFLDSFSLNDIMPLDIGDYRLKLELEYYLDDEKLSVTSDFLVFKLLKNYGFREH